MSKEKDINRASIVDAYIRLYISNGKHPSYQDIANDTGLTKQTVWNHFKDISLDDLAPAFKSQTPEITDAVAKKAKKGDTQAAKLWYDIIEKFIKKVDITTGGESLNNISDNDLINRINSINNVVEAITQ